MKFDLQKQGVMQRRDNSKKGAVDKEVAKLLSIINSKNNYYSTSSCSGRIMLLKLSKTGRKDHSDWLLSSHQPIAFSKIKAALKELPEEEVWFRSEPFIAHIACRTLDDAKHYIGICNTAGFKHSGIIALSRRIIVESYGSDFIDAIVSKNKKLLCDESYLKVLLSAANKKLKSNMEKIKRLEELAKGL